MNNKSQWDVLSPGCESNVQLGPHPGGRRHSFVRNREPLPHNSLGRIRKVKQIGYCLFMLGFLCEGDGKHNESSRLCCSFILPPPEVPRERLNFRSRNPDSMA